MSKTYSPLRDIHYEAWTDIVKHILDMQIHGHSMTRGAQGLVLKTIIQLFALGGGVVHENLAKRYCIVSASDHSREN